MWLSLSPKAIFSFLKIKNYFHFHYICSIPLRSSAAEVRPYFAHRLVNIMFLRYLSHQRNVEYLTELINGSTPSLHSGEDEARELVILVVKESSNNTTPCKCWISQLKQLMSFVSDPVWVPGFLSRRLIPRSLAAHLLPALPTPCQLHRPPHAHLSLSIMYNFEMCHLLTSTHWILSDLCLIILKYYQEKIK